MGWRTRFRHTTSNFLGCSVCTVWALVHSLAAVWTRVLTGECNISEGGCHQPPAGWLLLSLFSESLTLLWLCRPARLRLLATASENVFIAMNTFSDRSLASPIPKSASSHFLTSSHRDMAKLKFQWNRTSTMSKGPSMLRYNDGFIQELGVRPSLL